MSDFIKINYGCGETKLEGYINIDIEEKSKPDIVCDLRKEPLPIKSETVEVVNCIHNLEHIEQRYWPQVLFEFHRVLIPDGELRLAYPEFEICAKYFIENYKGMRKFWRWTLYGRQLYPGDYHVVPMRTAEVFDYLEKAGFKNLKSTPEPIHDYNMFVLANKGDGPVGKDDVLRKELFKL